MMMLEAGKVKKDIENKLTSNIVLITENNNINIINDNDNS